MKKWVENEVDDTFLKIVAFVAGVFVLALILLFTLHVKL